MGSYRISQSAGLYSNLPLDDGVQNSVAVGNSAISFGQLRNKRLNIVVDISGQTTFLEVLLGPSAAIIGAGGAGGDFTATETIEQQVDADGNLFDVFTYLFDAGAASSGSSALGIDYPTALTNNGYIQNGFGGGGAGGFRSR